MNKRELGRTNLTVSQLGLGTWGLSGDAYGDVDDTTQNRVIDRALSLGITLFETADVYAKGAMESKLGQRLPKDDSVVIVTKIGTDLAWQPQRKRFDVEYLEQAFDASRKRLDRDVLDVVLLHNPSDAVFKSSEVAEFMQGLVESGKLRGWGISAGSPKVVFEALEQELVPYVVQIAFNAFNPTDYRAIERKLKEKSVAVLARSVLAHGLLAGFWPVDKVFPPEDHRSDRWTPDQLRRRIHQLRAMKALNTILTPSMRAGAVGYVLHHEVSAAILGPRNVVQLDQLVREVPDKPPHVDDRARQQLEVQLTRLRVFS